MPQTNVLFEGTALDNIARGQSSPRHHEQAQRLVQTMPLLSWISGQPLQLQAPVGRDGLLLSGGQRQILCLARAYFGEPQLVVLDEPTASLDDTGFNHMLNWLQTQRQRGCTQVIITHRPELLALADKVLLLQNGNQAFFGTYDELQRRSTAAREAVA
jgi:ATP-binding cassette subfamily C exporter for protease/lipase